MAGEDDFELWLGRIGKDKALGARLRVAANRAGRQLRASGGKPSKFTGARRPARARRGRRARTVEPRSKRGVRL